MKMIRTLVGWPLYWIATGLICAGAALGMISDLIAPEILEGIGDRAERY